MLALLLVLFFSVSIYASKYASFEIFLLQHAYVYYNAGLFN